ncbi:MAG: hypothetical protein ACR2N3_05415 [Pyrinomonadaceae bacterium]
MEREIIHDTAVTGAMPMAAGRRVSWGAIFAGAVVALVVQLMLSVLGIGIGASTINPLTEQNPAAGLGTGAAIWFVLTSIVALFAGGWVAGRLAGMPRDDDRALHGILTWGLATLLTFYLLTTAIGGLIGGTANLLTRGMSAVNVDSRTITRAENATNTAANTVANQLPSEQRTREVGNEAASGVARAGIWTFIFMLVGAVAAALGGYASSRRHDVRRVDVDTVRTT